MLLGHRHGKKRLSSGSLWIIIRRTGREREPQIYYDLFLDMHWHYIEYQWIRLMFISIQSFQVIVYLNVTLRATRCQNYRNQSWCQKQEGEWLLQYSSVKGDSQDSATRSNFHVLLTFVVHLRCAVIFRKDAGDTRSRQKLRQPSSCLANLKGASDCWPCCWGHTHAYGIHQRLQKTQKPQKLKSTCSGTCHDVPILISCVRVLVSGVVW